MVLTWAKVLLIALQLLDKFVGWLEAQKYIAEGEQLEAARTLASIAGKLKVKDHVRAAIDAMSDAAVDDELRKLESVAGAKPKS